jgi:hypothetical protein
MIFTSPIESFFKSPHEPLSDQGDGILFHLRRDLEQLYGREGDFIGDVSAHAMLAMMGVLAGIDYLSQVYSSENSSRKKFVELLENLCNMTNDDYDSEAVYQLRCALVHHVSLSTISYCSYRNKTKFTFEVTDANPAPLIQKLSDVGSEVSYRISFWELKRAFLKVIRELENIARNVCHPKNKHVINMIGQMHSEKLLKA